ncbi:hypothetical protein PTSG_13158 [Salpingoeca rosetta]|uniref:Sulfotransferase domain-containing protein n=1 Tax=Salpingoeca rosetta (strain ATCC 50818 / BSB-021) TaxID=946362 RepID=F2USV0_SALR5|nr:uncharacterized protein PTSG_13158 [Salpingoeca rosetta]EGD81209.1 hypothetical protein PTSG_13158 [Salpingoeca rosetta]|eukprot:XP_004987743.1 hypothetical protein PTSG_13158 [Salpingoeca rosetta]
MNSTAARQQQQRQRTTATAATGAAANKKKTRAFYGAVGLVFLALVTVLITSSSPSSSSSLLPFSSSSSSSSNRAAQRAASDKAAAATFDKDGKAATNENVGCDGSGDGTQEKGAGGCNQCDLRPRVTPKVACHNAPIFLAHFPLSGGTSLHGRIAKASKLLHDDGKPRPCPGNLVTESMRSWGKTKQCPGQGYMDEKRQASFASNLTQWDNCDFFTSHDPSSVLLYLPCSNFRPVALLRHPLEHRWSMWNKQWHVHPYEHHRNFTYWLLHDKLAKTYQLYFYADALSIFPVTYLHPGDLNPVRKDMDLALRVAKDNLDTFAVVGTTERMGDTIRALALTMGLSREQADALVEGTTHVHQNAHKSAVPEEAQRAEVLDGVLWHEMELYRHANAKLDHTLASFGESSERDRRSGGGGGGGDKSHS